MDVHEPEDGEEEETKAEAEGEGEEAKQDLGWDN